ncbi:MAG TPA: hypothetical protein DCP63_15250 [Bacteroidetes bacterium]|nr:hypothetical protein [Bacteroidota bacterium]
MMKPNVVDTLECSMPSLSHAEGLRTEFLSRVSHELRTPLTSIIGYAEVILTDPKLASETRQEFAEIIRNEGKKLSNLIDDCLELAFGDQDKLHRERVVVDVGEILEQAVGLVAVEASSKSIEICFKESETPVHAIVNCARLQQIIQNFLVNSVLLSPVGGKVEIEMPSYDSTFEIEIRGRDIPLTDRNAMELCRDFKWIHAQNVELCRDGIGLAFAKHLVELQGGSLTIQGDGGIGLTFLLRFAK